MNKRINFYLIFFLIFHTNLIGDLSNFQKGRDLFEAQKFDLAKFKFEQDIVFNPKNEKSYLYLAKIYKVKKNDDLEESYLNTVILLNPKNEEAIFNLALLKIRKSNYVETQELIKTFKQICKKTCYQSTDLQKKLDNILKN